MILSSILLYLSLTLVTGMLIYAVIPAGSKPPLAIRPEWMLVPVLLLPIVSFFPLLPLLGRLDGQELTLTDVLFRFSAGQSWIGITVLSIFLLVMVLYLKPAGAAIPGLFLLLGIFFSISWSSHAGSLSPIIGTLAHTLHLLAITGWIGILFIVTFFTKNENNWAAFLRWFTPGAIVCFVVAAGTGVLMSTVLVPFQSLPSAWSTDYGSTLLVKQLLYLPVVYFAFINGFLIRSQMKKRPDFSAKPWARAEAVLLIGIFSLTAWLTEQAPPIRLESLLRLDGTAGWFSSLTGLTMSPFQPLHVELTATGILFLLFAGMFSVLFFLTFRKSLPALMSLLFAVLTSASLVIAILTSLRV